MSHESKKLRLNKLVDRGLQLRMVMWFALTGTLSVGLQFMMTVNAMSELALEAQASPADAYNAAAGAAVRVLVTTLAISLPVITTVGVLVSFRVTGPLHRLRGFLQQIARGEHPGDVRLRKGDELQDFARLLNDATRPLRGTAQDEGSAEDGGRRVA